MVNPNILSMNGACTFINLCSYGFNTILSFGKNGIDLFKKLKQQSHKIIMPSNSNISLIPKTMSTFSWISNTNIYISTLCPCISTIISLACLLNLTLVFVFPLL